jgi:hypothetical protein
LQRSEFSNLDFRSALIQHLVPIATFRERGGGGGIFSAIGSMAEAVREKLTVSGEDDRHAHDGVGDTGSKGSHGDVILRAKDVDVIELAGKDPSKQGKM